MNYYLNEIESVKTLNEIRINNGAIMKSDKQELNGQVTISSTINIEKFNNLWDKVHFELALNDDSTIEKIDLETEFSVYLTNSQNSDKLIIADNETQKQNNSNIFDIAYYMYNNIWIPVAKSELKITEEEWNSLIPDIVKLIPEQDFKEMNYQKLEKYFDYVTMDKELSGLLHAEFFMGEQPIMVFYKEFYDFCKKYEIF